MNVAAYGSDCAYLKYMYFKNRVFDLKYFILRFKVQTWTNPNSLSKWAYISTPLSATPSKSQAARRSGADNARVLLLSSSPVVPVTNATFSPRNSGKLAQGVSLNPV